MHKISLYLLGFKGFDVLQYISDIGKINLISSVLIGKDPGVIDDYSEKIQNMCEDLEIQYRFRDSKNTSPIDTDHENLYILCVGWKWMIPENKRSIVLHDSILPNYRGFAPLVSQLINQETMIGVTAIEASSDYDCGPIICQSSIQISYPIKISQAIKEITFCYRSCVKFIFNELSTSSTLTSHKQDESQASYSLWRDDLDYLINWNMDSSYIKRFIDSVGVPYDGAKTTLNGK